VWDSVNKVIYLSAPSTATANANTIAVLNPSLGTIVSAKSAGSEPDALAIAGDSSYLYVGLDGQSTVQRFTLPALATDISYPLGTSKYFGPYFALDLQVAPGAGCSAYDSRFTLCLQCVAGRRRRPDDL
jgi:hypothetical protein